MTGRRPAARFFALDSATRQALARMGKKNAARRRTGRREPLRATEASARAQVPSQESPILAADVLKDTPP